MFKETRFFITYELDGSKFQTDQLYLRAQANIEKSILEEDGAKNVKIVKYNSVLI
jgi:hypothetical protein